jgi:hypothetical protein
MGYTGFLNLYMKQVFACHISLEAKYIEWLTQWFYDYFVTVFLIFALCADVFS